MRGKGEYLYFLLSRSSTMFPIIFSIFLDGKRGWRGEVNVTELIKMSSFNFI